MKLRLLSILFLACSSFLFAQEDWDRKAFVKELRASIKENTLASHRKAGNQFIRYWNASSFDEGQEEYIYQLTKNLQRKRFRDAEDYFQLFRLLNHYGAGELNDESFDNFLAVSVDHVAQLKHKTAKKYIKYCTQALVDSVLHMGQSFQWKLGEGDIYFTFDSVPKISAEYIKLYCASRVDTISIEMTQGYVNLQDHTWNGKGGRCDWTKHNIPEDSIWVELADYKINLRKQNFEAKGASLLGNLEHDENSVVGTFSDGLSSNPNRKGAIYPGFISDENALYFYNVFEDVDAEGALEIRGKRMFLYARGNKPVELTFYEDDEPFIKAQAKRFRMEDARIYANDVSLTLSWQGDSIVHPQLNLNYIDSLKSLTFERSKQNIGMSPIRSSYHQLDCYFDVMEWRRDSSAIFFSNSGSPAYNPALLESFDYYSEARYRDIETMDKRHPAFMLRTLSRESRGDRKFFLEEIARYYRFSVDNAHQLMTDFAVLGFVDFNTDLGYVSIKDRLFNFLESRLEERDYDQLRMVSRSDSHPYARMDLVSGDLQVMGVSLVELSDSNKVAVFPYEEAITIHGNRDFTVDGIIQTGNFALFGEQMDFVYDSYVIDLEKIDSLQYEVPSGFDDRNGNPTYWTVKTVISDITGKLFIDGSQNKSGLKDMPDFPKLHSYEDSYIYYDRIKNGVYARDLFSFKVNPFQLDSMLQISTENLEFPGNLNAPTIFPNFEDTMRLDEDLELSFIHNIKTRYPAYESRGSFEDYLVLDNSGLHGKGAIYYLNSVTATDSVYFYPYRALAHGNSHRIYEQKTPSDCPPVHVEDASIDWRAFQDEMESKNRDAFYTAYEEQYEFDGLMVLSPDRLIASGELYYDDALSVSPDFILQSRDFTADHSLFNLYDRDERKKTILGRKLFTEMDFDEDFGSFEGLTDSSRFELRKNQYHLYFDLMEWDRSNLSMSYSQLGEEAAWLVSVDKYQDSLQFFASDALYDLTNYELDVFGVSEIWMPPVSIEPDSSHIRILANGKMETLRNAKLWVDTETITDYSLYDATLDIQSGGRFTGSGTFDYIDLEGEIQPIFFSSLAKKGKLLTGTAYIKEEDNFHLDPYFGFKGKVQVDSSQDFLTFDGDTRVHLACDKLNRAWIPFIDAVDPMDVFIDLNPDVRLTDRQQWHAGFMVSHAPTVFYPTFLSSPKRGQDYELLGVDGFVNFDEDSWKYIVASEEKIKDPSIPGNMAIYDPEECTLYAEGVMNLEKSTGLVDVGAVGSFFADIKEQTITGTVDLSFDFLMNRKAAKLLYKELKRSTADTKVNQTNELHQRMLLETLGKRKLRKYNRKKRKGRRYLPKELAHTLYFPQLKFVWNKQSASLLADGRLPLNNIVGKKLDRMVRGVVEIRPHKTGDEINIYIEISKNNFYYFSYRRGIMEVISTNAKFNDLINHTPEFRSYRKGTSETGPYRLQLGIQKKLQKFLVRIGWE